MMKIETGFLNHYGIESLRGRNDREAVNVAAKEIESLFAYELIKAMRGTFSESTGGPGNSVYTSLFDMALARLMAERGLGLKEMLLKKLRQEDSVTPQAEKGQKNTGESPYNIKRGDDVTPMTPTSEPHKFKSHDYLSRWKKEEDTEIRPPVNGTISSHFGPRKHPVYGDNRFHHGLDISAPEGTDIYPIRPGQVIFSGEKGGYGNVVEIDHGDGYVSRYAHNKVNLVRAGDYVDADTVIAKVGSTGLSTGPHLHFEVRHNGTVIDPATIIAKN